MGWLLLPIWASVSFIERCVVLPKKSEWCKYSNFKQMYNLLYKAIHMTGVAEKLSEPEWQNEYGQKVSCESESIGEKIRY